MDDTSFNPYAPPQTANPVAASGGECYRQGNLLIVPRASAPYVPCDTCVKCGQPATRVLPRNFSWHIPALCFLFLEQMKVSLGLCDHHRAVRRRWIRAAWLLFLACPVLWWLGISYLEIMDGWWLPVAMLCLLLSLVVAWIATNFIPRPRRITKEEGQFSGAGEGYLRQFESR